MREWDYTHFGHINTELQKVRDKLSKLNKEGMDGERVKSRKKLEQEEGELLEKEETMWFQRARANKFTFVDRTTKFFHKKASG